MSSLSPSSAARPASRRSVRAARPASRRFVRAARAAVAALLAVVPAAVVLCPAGAAAGLRISDLTLASGVVFPDVDVSGDGPGANDFVTAQVLRASVPLGSRWSFFGEADRARVPSSRLFGDAETLSLRGGFRRWTGGPWESRFFADAAVGWIRLALDHRALAVDRPLCSAGLGQLFPLGDRAAIHWEVRGDFTMEDRGDPIRAGISQPSLLVGLTLRFPEPRDRDGVADDDDACPATPAGALVDAAGCSLDEDFDGIADGLDRCPGTPRGAPVDAAGCSVVSDTDSDGVPDGLDRCPGTPSHVLVDAEGCPRDARFEVAGPVVLQGVRFETASTRLTEDARVVLDTVAESLRDRPEVRVEIAGHADSQERDEDTLALRRAESVRAYLIAQGVPEAILVARGYGAGEPAARGGTSAARAANRRVELKRVEGRP
jgi:OOP family OmpA-OmpF porin